ncbi:mannose-1-phosphate guanylyltransferase/mannose-6-phosphate isomerase [Burkholderia vietnamiensis]|jgi:mannose-1-phosphate guanylyltransferase/mannose-6-phosphate isomerase|uniref:mannose-1-phosphate guanylyltransferase/mannose-6-phosphate isomerase n=1 Tax=Burkholderia vietnamiensis TaxID=60552 RepID=UPI000757E32E|nr:mannose-1-phosphate guanylyltransferase/mannose-6-phosphate isomerase [Burkholderia vietnamiensis]KVE14698.1 mannose-1-phosphate guanyltransferase [Burkholderia vietnamiensis]KVF34852.1 mannose-1-phosphate guanyltransferase [Burkholderia vietnamiensis]MCA8192979.1 mannose-1-phosphate guanylyltransferase/mannose-6-phosphate isomerase [Burkholderia vietnamiensis]MDN7409113.1 mannose-1-phosphate guanylyltransferase/mannose-6-phosphate isomerase [Burkholderia vietnamiensis]MDN8065692.1 mannose-
MNAPAVAAVAADTPPSSAATDAALRVAVQPVILAGGSGTRLWPMSREHYPKQLIGLLGDHSLLQSTALRLDGLAASHPVNDDVLIVCGEDHRFTTAEQLRVTGKRASIMLEPLGRDTAPALTLAALRIVADGSDAVMTVMPADHAVADRARFHAAVAAGVHCAAQGKIATMGIVPARAETGYGYIRVGALLGDAATGGLDVRRLDRFVEKPHLELARQYVESGEYWWNSGIFIVRASVWLDAIRRLEPEIHAACEQAVANGKQDGDFFRVDRDAFAASPSNSIDYAVMEPLASQPQLCESVVVPLDAGWSDVGSWDAIWQILPKDDAGNVGRGHVLFENADSTFAHAESRLVACVGTQNLVVVETPDAVLVADKSRVQDVKKIVGRIKAERGAEATDHRKVHRPWGHYDSVDMGERFQVKRIVVKPGARLSLQMHHHRAEHWIVVRGTARITRGDETFLLSENESTYIPLGVSHRLENPGKMPLELIEVQSGAYLGEDDIVRFDDTYGRQ